MEARNIVKWVIITLLAIIGLWVIISLASPPLDAQQSPDVWLYI